MPRKKPYLLIRWLQNRKKGTSGYYITAFENASAKMRDNAVAVGGRIASKNHAGLADIELSTRYESVPEAAQAITDLGFEPITPQKLRSEAEGRKPIV